MTAASALYDIAEYAWMLGPEPEAELGPAQLRARETRLAAMLFKRRWSLLLRWRRQSLCRTPGCVDQHAPATTVSVKSLPECLAPLRAEIAIWKSFLAADLDAILFGTS